MTQNLRSPLRYPGGKSRWSKKIVASFQANESYIEPFVGGGSVFIEQFRSSPNSTVWINDKYAPVYDFWRSVRDDGRALLDQIRTLKNSFTDGRDLYDRLKRSEDRTPTEEGARFFVLNRITFSGLSDSGGFSKHAFESRFTETSIRRLERLINLLPKNFEITNLDFVELFEKSRNSMPASSFVFLDPPYARAEPSRLYGREGNLHTNFDHQGLFDVLTQVPYSWAMTYDDTETVRSLYQDNYHLIEWSLYYPMTNQSDRTTNRGNELFITNDQLCAEAARRILNDPR
jgi:DNA adenine methylase